jgi:hypothetical protein
MSKGKLRFDLVTVSAPMPLTQHIATVHQLGQDLVGAALRNADYSSDVAQADARIMGDAQEDVRVIGQEVPAAGLWRCVPRYSLEISGIRIHEIDDTLYL